MKAIELPWLQKIDSVKDYYGEQIGLYFLWLREYTTFLIPAAILGFLAWLWIAIDST